jgi:hypothetical protein
VAASASPRSGRHTPTLLDLLKRGMEALRKKKLPDDRFKNGMTIISEALVDFQEAHRDSDEKPVGPYSNGYFALRALIRDRTDPSDLQQLQAAAYAVYGWMPTILKDAENLLPLSEFVFSLRELSVFDARLIVGRLATQGQASIFLAVNKSTVGTSKLLHFLLPEIFPIWDSRIARLFGFKHSTHNTASAYLAYFDLLHRWLESGASVSSELYSKMQIGAPANDPVSNLRIIEYALFMSSVSKFGGDANEP